MIPKKQSSDISKIFSEGRLLKHYSMPIMQDIGIDKQGLMKILETLKNLSIKIQYINTFYKTNRTLALCDFSYSGNSVDECYEKLHDFLEEIQDNDELLYSIDFITDNPESVELNILLDKVALGIT